MDLVTKTGTTTPQDQINLKEILEDIFMVLTEKEKHVIVKRFCLDNQPRETLERIGSSFSVTRERIRQIEKIALNKLRRTVVNTKLNLINEVAKEIIDRHGGVMLEDNLVFETLAGVIGQSGEGEEHIIRLALNINQSLEKSDKSQTNERFWYNKDIDVKALKNIANAAVKLLKRTGDLVRKEKFIVDLQETLRTQGVEADLTTIESMLETDVRMKEVEDGYGLMTWRNVNPKSIRDKAFIVLKQIGKPLHFKEIAEKISSAEFDKKSVTEQAVHNELIRYEQFVLVGRGLYALKEWGYKEGTVEDVIRGLLAKKSPMSKQDIILGVLKQRQVKKGTISLNLQKCPDFVRVGRAIYSLKESK
ncbi:MAG: sigma factor-like helix-turn-helix DNA-binding protein [Candidatus Peregrinibacteria bacterium]|nr:sigma factor-like helix-turn-helix DNA-binding protein [Candidatus Peregrinibacteria bacterium]MDZ4245030.1 sigma factor-like helix-turn-helix DNA-binding protein [Candidatus Gracilibacteria bacterium]